MPTTALPGWPAPLALICAAPGAARPLASAPKSLVAAEFSL